MVKLQEACQAIDHEIIIGGALFADSMGDEGTPEGTYQGMMDFNRNTISSKLQ
ncbi:MAG: hypothetical protein HRT74_11210 [Flavobacteriales bacterium]|nr:hypothetical protein [Flavobacteriales bacterium]